MRMSWIFPAFAIGLRVSFPILIFYVERETEIDVWRVLHDARDIPAWMREPQEE